MNTLARFLQCLGRRSSGIVHALCISALLVCASTNAATSTWTGGGANGNWMTAGNWQGSIVPTAGDDLVFPAGPVNKTGSNDFAIGTAFASIVIGAGGYTFTGNSITLGAGGITCDNQTVSYAQSALSMAIILPAMRPLGFTGLGNSELALNGLVSGAGGWQMTTTPGVNFISGVVQLYNGGNSFAGGMTIASSYVGARASGVLGTGPIIMSDANVSIGLSTGATLANALFAQGGGLHGNGGLSGNGGWSGPITVQNYTGFGAVSSPEMVLSGAITGDANAQLNAPENHVDSVVTLTANSPAFVGVLHPAVGKLNVNAAFPNARADLSNSYQDTTLAGTGSIGGAVTLGPLTHLTPGYNNAPGKLTTGNLNLQQNSVLDIRLNGSTPGVNQSQVDVTGTVTLAGNLSVILQPGYVVPVGASYTIIANDGVDAVTGTFAGLPEGAAFTAGGVPFLISYVGGSGNDVVITAQSRLLTVAVAGSGVGGVSGTGAGPISCGNGGAVCTQSFNTTGTTVTLTATATGSSTFTGWIGGGCLLLNPCVVTMNTTQTVTATFALTASGPFNLDIDKNSPNSPGAQRAATDGVMILRYLFGMTGSAISNNAMGPSFVRTAAQIPTYLVDVRPLLDVDGNSQVDALTDGLLILRHMLGLTGAALTTNALGPNSTRNAGTIQTYINGLLPP